MPVAANQSGASLWAVFKAAITSLVARCRCTVRSVLRGYRGYFVRRRLCHLDRDDVQIHESVQDERLYLLLMESSAKDALMENNRRRYRLQRRLIDLNRAAL